MNNRGSCISNQTMHNGAVFVSRKRPLPNSGTTITISLRYLQAPADAGSSGGPSQGAKPQLAAALGAPAAADLGMPPGRLDVD